MVLVAAVVISLSPSAYGQGKKPARPGGAVESAETEDQVAEEGEKGGPLTMDDIAQMRRQHVAPDKIVQQATERGVKFEVAAAERGKLRHMGFKPAQIDAIKDAHGEAGKVGALVPGQGLRTTDAQRDQILKEITKITATSGADIQPVQAQHITLWAAKDVQAAFLPELKNLESYLRTKCKEPIRSGLDNRSAHSILIKRRYDFEKWVNAMYDLIGDRFKDPNDPGGNTNLKASIIKGWGFYTFNFVVLCLEDKPMDRAHREAAAGVGYMYLTQLAETRQIGPMATGFANGAECILFGTPSVMIFSSVYGMGDRNLGADPRAWLHLVRMRITTKQASTVEELLNMGTTTMVLPHYAEAWSLVSLLAKQPEKFAALVLKLREETSALKAIEDVYGWNEKKLTAEWHDYVLGQR